MRHFPRPRVTELRANRSKTKPLVALSLVALLTLTALTACTPTSPHSQTPQPSPSATFDSHGEVSSYPAAPKQASQDSLAALPLATWNSTIPALLDQSKVRTSETWLVAQPTAPLTALYGAMSATSVPVAALGSSAVEDTTRVAVFGVFGDWLLVGTPSRTVLPSANGGTAPSVSFSYARATDFILIDIDKKVVVDSAASTLSIVSKDGSVLHSETVVVGTPDDPTPTGGQWGYIEATYTDAESQPWTDGKSIALTSAHPPTIDSWGGENGAGNTGIHYSTSGGTGSHGCIRASVEVTELLEPLIGIPVLFR